MVETVEAIVKLQKAVEQKAKLETFKIVKLDKDEAEYILKCLKVDISLDLHQDIKPPSCMGSLLFKLEGGKNGERLTQK